MPPDRRTARERLALRAALLRLDPPLEAVAEDVLGAVSRIELVARDPDGGVTLVLTAGAGSDLARLAEGLAQCAWLAPRLADWNQLAPHLGLASERGVRLLLACPHFDERTRLAAESLGSERVRLVELLPRGDLDLELRLPGEAGPRLPGDGAAPAPHPATGFRTGLRD
jgi:hypothetical protein